MSSLATSPSSPAHSRAFLRLVGDAEGIGPQPGRSEQRTDPERVHADADTAHVLVVGAETGGRSQMLAELRNVLPKGTCFLEAEEAWKVLACAADSQMVVLVDDLGELSRSSLVRLLARRQPGLPVFALGATTKTHADAASM